MSDSSLTYVFKDDKGYALLDGQVIASHTDPTALEVLAQAEVEERERKPQETEEERAEKKRKSATHITTPNGLSGEILGRTPTVWGDEVTVRFDNGQIRTFASHAVSYEQRSRVASTDDPVVALNTRLEQGLKRIDRESLTARLGELDSIRAEAAGRVSATRDLQDATRLDAIVSAAENEKRLVREALQALDAQDAEAFAPPAPFRTEVVEQADLGGAKGTWLDQTVQDMIDEVQADDYDKLMDEGPETLVAELDDGVVADQGATALRGRELVEARTAGVTDSKLREEYTQHFLDRLESLRKAEIVARAQNVRQAATEKRTEVDQAPDEALFL
jgi:hypothetical protein